MLAKRPRLFMVVLLISGCLLGLVWGCLGGLTIGKVPEVENQTYKLQEKPVRLMIISIDPSQQDELFDRLRKYAGMWRYAVRIAPDDPSSENYVVQMWRIDMKLSGSYSTDSGTLNLGFFNTDPAGRNPWWFFDDEIKDLRSLISEIPNSTFTMEK
jgi:hypothetical protein